MKILLLRMHLNSAPQNCLGSEILFLKCFLPLSIAALPSGEEIWYLLLFLEFHLLESWEYCRPQLSVRKRYISSTDRWRKSRKPLWICKKQIETSPCIARVFWNCQSKRFWNLSHGFSAMGSHLWLLLKISAKGEREKSLRWSLGFHHARKLKKYKVKLQCQERAPIRVLLRVVQWWRSAPGTSHLRAVPVAPVLWRLSGQPLPAGGAGGRRVRACLTRACYSSELGTGWSWARLAGTTGKGVKRTGGDWAKRICWSWPKLTVAVASGGVLVLPCPLAPRPWTWQVLRWCSTSDASKDATVILCPAFKLCVKSLMVNCVGGWL